MRAFRLPGRLTLDERGTSGERISAPHPYAGHETRGVHVGTLGPPRSLDRVFSSPELVRAAWATSRDGKTPVPTIHTDWPNRRAYASRRHPAPPSPHRRVGHRPGGA